MGKKIFILVAMCIGIFLCMLDTTIMNIALPAIQKGLNVNLSDLSWALNIYTILFATLTIPLAKFAEIIGIHKGYLVGLITFSAGSIASSMATSVPYLIVGRGIQSIGAAIVFPLSMTIGISLVDTKARPKVIAALGVTQGLAAALGPIIGGLLTQYLSWRWIFLINVPLMLVAILLVLLFLPLKETVSKRKIDIFGSVLSMMALFSLTLLLVKGREWGWVSLPIISLLIVFVLSLIGFFLVERKTDNPMIPLALFKNRQFSGAAIAIILSNLFLVGVTVILPTYFTNIQHKDEVAAALIITPITAMIFIFSPLAAILLEKLGARLIICLGFGAMLVAYAMFYKIDLYNNVQVLVACLLLGFGYGIIAGPITVLAAADFTGDLLSASQSVAGVLRQVGVVLAVAIFVTSLYANLGTAKTESHAFAETTINKIALPAQQKKVLLEKTDKAIDSGDTDTKYTTQHFTQEQIDGLVEENYQAALKKAGAVVSADAQAKIHADVEKQVNATVASTNELINRSIGSIQKASKGYFTRAFTVLYGFSLPFIGLGVLGGFVFRHKTIKF